MAFHILANFIVALLFGSIPSWNESSNPSIRPVIFWQGTDRYYIPKKAADYNGAARICKNNYGSGYGLAAITSAADQRALESFLSRNVSPQTDLWIGGSYNVGGRMFVWTNVKGDDGRPLPLSAFAVNLIEGYPRKYNTNDRTVFFQRDQFTSIIKIVTVTAIRRFVCEYRIDRIVN